jgi:two-component system CheB/CheR fusion protein
VLNADGPGSAPFSQLKFPVVGIGGSAGGVQALLSLFEHMPASPGMAFVVILHLSRDQESHAAAILQRVTRMPVSQVTLRVPIEIDHIYVIAPRADLIMTDGHLELSATERRNGPAVAIDVFFRTLAMAHGHQTFCIVLSGTGSDGAVGLSHVKEQGGITIAQSKEDAEHDDMPASAIATGMVDFVMPTALMGEKLVELWSNSRHMQIAEPVLSPGAGSRDALSAEPASSEALLQEIMALLRSQTRHDFRHYKRGTVIRRIERRLQVHGLHDLISYRDYLRSNPGEAVPLLQDLLISVTSFFRDGPAFDVLEKDVIPRLFEARHAGEKARVWVAGCATGEESYSLSILLREAAPPSWQSADIQVFATDIDERAIRIARRGTYPNGIAADVSPDRLRRFFDKEQGQYRVNSEVREQVLFATHNLLRDPPFSRLDLVCCRNLLIYLDQRAQTSVLEMFRYALKPGGYLFLGASESADASQSLFTTIDKKNRIYRADTHAIRRGKVTIPDAVLDARREASADLPALPRTASVRSAYQQHLEALQAVSPASVLIDEKHDVLHLSPTFGRYMVRGAGLPSNNLLDNVESALRQELRTALFQASQTGSSILAQVQRQQADGSAFTLKIGVHPMAVNELGTRHILVAFHESEALAEDRREDDPDDKSSTQNLMIGKLEEDNRQLKVQLQETLEQFVLGTEELRASNEELQAINEELRSATEELETSKEELQSMNEELGTVNVELRSKVEERERINDDLQNLITSAEVATVFVDSTMCIKRFTPQASKLFSFVASDIGRSLLDITNRLNYAEMAADAESVFKNLGSIERQITTTDQRRFFARILPYRTRGDRIEGAVLTFFDVTELRVAEDSVRVAEERLRLAAASTSDFAIITTDDAGTIINWNNGAERIFGYRADEMAGHSLGEIFTPEDRANGVPEAEMLLAREVGRADDEGWRQRKDGTTFYCSGVLTRMQSSHGSGFSKIARDLTGSKRYEIIRESLLLEEQRASLEARRDVAMKDQFLAVMSHELKQPLNTIQFSAELLTRLPETREIAAAMRIGMTIERAVRSQTEIINDLLDLSRIRTGKLRLSYEEVDLGELVRNLAQAAAGDVQTKELELSVAGADHLVCRCDRVRVEQVMWNLISNAIKFSPAGGRVCVGIDLDEQSARLSVTDWGCGISAEFLPHVFEIFNQADSQKTPSNGGLGIGLALVNELVQAHRGRVEARSAGLDQGSVFTVWLPLKSETSPELPAASSVTTKSLDLAGLRVLAVDDDEESLCAFATLLGLEGAFVTTAGSAEIALEILDTAAHDLLISDISMPGTNGYQFIVEVRRRFPDKGPCAIALSGHGRKVDALLAIKAGFDAHIAKPASLKRIKEVLAQLDFAGWPLRSDLPTEDLLPEGEISMRALTVLAPSFDSE